MKGAKAEDGAKLVGVQWVKDLTTWEPSIHRPLEFQLGIPYRPIFLSQPQLKSQLK